METNKQLFLPKASFSACFPLLVNMCLTSLPMVRVVWWFFSSLFKLLERKRRSDARESHVLLIVLSGISFSESAKHSNSFMVIITKIKDISKV